MLAKRKMTGGPKKLNRETKRTGELKRLPSKLKSKVIAEAETEVSSPPNTREPVESPSSPEPEVQSDGGHIFGFTDDDDDDSSDEGDVMDTLQPELGVLKLPTVPKDDATIKRKLEQAKREPVIVPLLFTFRTYSFTMHQTGDHGVIYLGHLPHGFYENQLRGYFSQFGDVTRLRLSRSKRACLRYLLSHPNPLNIYLQSGRSKHYAFLEFDSSSVAKIVAETMDNYLLMGQILRCDVIPKDKVHPEIWVGANKKWKKAPKDRIERVKHDKVRRTILSCRLVIGLSAAGI